MSRGYPNYQKLKLTEGIYRISTPQLARMHRLNIGTITSNSALNLVYTNRQRIGIVEESFVSKLKKGDVFFFGGRQLEFVMVKDMVVYVRNTRRTSTVTPIWGGGKLAISDTLSHHLRQEIDRAVSSSELNRELTCIQPILQAQSRISHLPKSTELLIETCKTREGQHLYVYPFAGRFVHEGLGFLWGYYFAAQKTATFTISANDYGYEILGPKDYPFQSLFSPDFFNPENLTEQIKTGLNISELTQRRFREIAQVAGLVFKGYPSSRKTSGQLQVSSSLLYEVFAQYEPGNLLLQQAEQEVIQQQLEAHRLGKTLRQMNQLSLIWKNPNRPSSFAFPLLIERLSSRLSNESLLERIERLKQQWEDQS